MNAHRRLFSLIGTGLACVILSTACGDADTSSVETDADTVRQDALALDADTAPLDVAQDAADAAAPDADSVAADVAADTGGHDAEPHDVPPDVTDAGPPQDALSDTPPSSDGGDTAMSDSSDTSVSDAGGGGCPTPVITIEEGAAVAPPITLHLSGLSSNGGTGHIATYAWSVDEPEGSFSFFSPSTQGASVTFETGIAGDYVFWLDVTDSVGTAGCAPARVDVSAVPVDPIHVELWWNDNTASPATPVGADLDLHVKHPNAVGEAVDDTAGPDGWFDTTWDVFWANPDPVWPAAGGGGDHSAVLLRRDDDGYGPEVIAIPNPETDVGYEIGFHVWDDTGSVYLQPTEVRIYVDGVLKNKPRFNTPLSAGGFWHMMNVSYPTGLTGIPFDKLSSDHTSTLTK